MNQSYAVTIGRVVKNKYAINVLFELLILPVHVHVLEGSLIIITVKHCIRSIIN